MILYVAALTTSLCLVVLAAVYLADLWEREPLELLQNAFLAGLAVQLALVLGAYRWGGVEAWSGWLYLGTLAALAVILPALLEGEKELDEPFDGVVYALTFTVGAAGAAHLFNLPGAVARYPERAALGGGETPSVRDLLLLLSSPGSRAELTDLALLLLVAALAGAVLGTLALQKRPLSQQIGGMLVTGSGLGAIALGLDGGWPVGLVLAAALGVTAVILKRRSTFRRRRELPERELVLGAFKTGLMVFGAIVLALALLMSSTDGWRVVTRPPEAPASSAGAGP